MRFLRKNKTEKSILVISDIHLGAGVLVDGKRNYLEDFHFDKELVDFLDYYSCGDYQNKEVELIINGDLFDLLAVPFVNYFDDEFWSEDAALSKLDMIIKAHPEVIEALNKFVSQKNKKLVYIIGNHDAEFVFESLRERFYSLFDEKVKMRVEVILNNNGEYIPVDGVVLKHGHEYELAHHFHPENSIVESDEGRKYFLPPWGSYYVTRVINKFKEERGHVNAVRPIRKFLINGFIYDTFFTLRFLFSTIFYFIMVRSIYLFKQEKSFKKMIKHCLNELELFKDYETMTHDFFKDRPEAQCLIVGHTHDPSFRSFSDGKIFINTGTWTRMFNLDFGKNAYGEQLSFAQVDIIDEEKKSYEINLNVWKGRSHLPFEEFS
jgi:UDP-2,3-diacylglucosamine pyrophosphatase LpxH